jgi:hypothetical protein
MTMPQLEEIGWDCFNGWFTVLMDVLVENAEGTIDDMNFKRATWKQTPLPSSHPTCSDNMLHCILFIKYFILNITKT